MAKEAIVIDVAMRAAEVSSGERCTHVGVSGVRCQRRRQDKDGYCRLHGVYENTMMATLGVPLPEDAVSLFYEGCTTAHCIRLFRPRAGLARFASARSALTPFHTRDLKEWGTRPLTFADLDQEAVHFFFSSLRLASAFTSTTAT